MPTKKAKQTKKKQKAKASKKAIKGTAHYAIVIKAREPNGRHQRDDAEETREQRMATVLAQPHRKGLTDQRCENALGRFCIRMKLRSELYQAGEEYRNAIRRWRLAKGLPVEGAHSLGSGQDASPEQVARLFRAMVDAQRVLVEDAGFRSHQAVRALIVEDLDLQATSESDGAAIDGLWALAEHFGLIKGGRGGVQQSTSAA